jgi:molybdopterin-guanine dinucleotide biosynthesis protein A
MQPVAVNVDATAANYRPALPAIILCGGRSRRMGRNKLELPLKGSTLYGCVEAIFASFASELVVVAAEGAAPPTALPRVTVVFDERPNIGPLEGLRVGLEQCATRGAEMAMVGTCDAPLVVPELYQFMSGLLARSPEIEAVVPFHDGKWYPLTAVYRTSVIPQIRARLARDEYKARELVESLPVIRVTTSMIAAVDPGLQSLRNINTPQDYLELCEELGEPPDKVPKP